MTIEIRQLIIRAIAEAKPEGAQRHVEPSRATSAPEFAHPTSGPVLSPEGREAIIAACVREVLREVRKGRER